MHRTALRIAASLRTGSRVFSQSLAGSSAGRFLPAPPAAAISGRPLSLDGQPDYAFEVCRGVSRRAEMACPKVLVTGGSGLVGQGIRWQV